MKYISCETLEWEYLTTNNIFVGRSQSLVVSDLLDIVHIRLQPKHTLPRHYHIRPQNGHQVFYFYAGGNFMFVGGENGKTIYDQRIPFYLIIGSGPDEAHSITNLDSRDLEFVCICAPRFIGPSEEVHL